jgi:DNA-binding transcriptional LysR family regulator
VRVELFSSNRRIDLVAEGFDIAIRVRERFDTDASLILRKLCTSQGHLVASPGWIASYGPVEDPLDLEHLPTLSFMEHEAQSLVLVSPDGRRQQVQIQPRLISGDFVVLLEAALNGVGVIALPDWIAAPLMSEGRLQAVLPDWSTVSGHLHLVYPSRRGLVPAVRVMIDFLTQNLASDKGDSLAHLNLLR